MDLQDLKRWHWMLIGLFVGSLWAAVQLFYGPQIDGKTFDLFEHSLLATAENRVPLGLDDGLGYVSDIRVHPMVIDDAPDATAATQPAAPQVQWVTGVEQLDRIKRDPKAWWVVTHRPSRKAFLFKATVPYRPRNPRDDFVAAKNPITSYPPYRLPTPVKDYARHEIKTYPTITDYFDELNRKFGPGTVKYRYNWWESSAAVKTIYPLGGLVLIGGVWPTVLGLLVGAGLGSKRKKEEYDLSRFKGTRKPSATAGDRVTEKDREQLASMTAELEKNLEASASASAPANNGAPVEASVRQLSGEALQPAEAKVATKPEKTYGADGGNYYPTEIHKAPKE